MALAWLKPEDPPEAFPPTEAALSYPNGLLAAGGDLSPDRLRAAYARGLFPWFNPGEPILWWSPDPRCVFYTDSLHISRSLQRRLRRNDYAVTLDVSFAEVLRGCAAPRSGQRGTWLVPQMRAAYQKLHEQGNAHSVEVWRQGRLIGGLYGVALGTMFFGESMFSREPDASKIALVWLVRQLQAWGFDLLDAQVSSLHLYRLGAVDISRAAFLAHLTRVVGTPRPRGAWRFQIEVPASAPHAPAD